MTELHRTVRICFISACVMMLFVGRANAAEKETGFIPVSVGNVHYMVEKKRAVVAGYNIPGSGSSLRKFLFSESLTPGLDTRGNSPGTVYQKCSAPIEILSNAAEHAQLKANVELINKYEVSISTKAVGSKRWQTIQHWKRTEGEAKTSITILVYVDNVVLNKNLIIQDAQQTIPIKTVCIADPGSSARAAAGSPVVFPNDRDVITLSVDRRYFVQGFFYGTGLSGFALLFSPDESNEFRLTLDHRAEDVFANRLGSTTVAVDKRDLTTQMWAGPYPVVSKLGIAVGNARQDMPPTTDVPAWSAHDESRGAEWKVTGRGNLLAAWQEEVTAERAGKDVICRISYRAEDRLPTTGRPALFLKFPYRIEGKRLVVTSKAKRISASAQGVRYRIGAVMKVGRLAGGESARLKVEPMRELVISPGRDAALELQRTFDNSGELLLTPVGDANVLSVELRYAHVAPEPEAEPAAFLAPPTTEGLEVYRDKPSSGDLTIASPYWCVVHRKASGGAIVSLRFYNGSGRELLLEPDETSITVGGTVFSSEFCSAPKIEVNRVSQDLVRLDVSGELASARGVGKAIQFMNSYEYHPWYAVRRSRIVPRDSVAGVTQVQLARLALSPNLDECYYRRSGWNVAMWRRTIFPGPDQLALTDGWAYIGVFKRGVEGVELFPRSDLVQWEEQIYPEGGRTFFGVTGNEAGGATILIQPYAHEEGLTVKKPLTYDFYLGLPPVKAHPGRPIMGVSTCVNWLSGRLFREVAAARPQIVWYHYLLGPGALVMKRERAIKLVHDEVARFHAAGIKVIPYTWFNSIGSNREGKKRAEEESWYRMETPESKPSTWVCYDSTGYREFLKRIEDAMFRQTPIDGVYYDWMGAFTCCNPKHGSQKHYSIDGVIDMVSWTRERLGGEGVIIGHIGGGAGEYPCATLEGYTTAVVTLEELYSATKIPTLYGVQASLEFMGATPRIICGAVVSRLRKRCPESDFAAKVIPAYQEFITKSFLWGYWPYYPYRKPPIPQGERYFKQEDLAGNWGYDRELRTLNQVDFSAYRFRGFARQTAVEIDNDFAKASVFFGERSALVIIGNPDSGDTHVVNFTVDCKCFGWDKRAPASIKEISFARTGQDQLSSTGGTIVLAGHDFRAYRLER